MWQKSRGWSLQRMSSAGVRNHAAPECLHVGNAEDLQRTPSTPSFAQITAVVSVCAPLRSSEDSAAQFWLRRPLDQLTGIAAEPFKAFCICRFNPQMSCKLT